MAALQLLLYLTSSPMLREAAVAPGVVAHLASCLTATASPDLAVAGLGEFRTTLMRVLEQLSQVGQGGGGGAGMDGGVNEGRGQTLGRRQVRVVFVMCAHSPPWFGSQHAARCAPRSPSCALHSPC